MASSSVIGALRVVLGADTAAFDRGLKNSRNSLSSFGTHVRRVGLAVGAAVTALSTAIGVGVSRSIANFDDLAKTSQSIGVTVQELIRLRHAADLSGVSASSLSTAVGRLSRNMSDVAAGAGAEAARAFDTLGISVKNTDGSLRGSTEIMAAVADRFAGMQDGAQKTAIALQLFGRAGADLVPLLNAGSAGLNEMMLEADALGLVIDTNTAQAAERFRDNLTRLGRVKDGIITQITARMLPALESISTALLDVARDSGLMEAAANTLSFALRGLVSAGVIVLGTFRTLGAVVSAVAGSVLAVVDGDFAMAWERLKHGAADAASEIVGTMTLIDRIWSEAASNAAAMSENQLAPAIRRSGEAADANAKGFAKSSEQVERFGGIAAGVGQTVQSSFNTAIDRLIDGSFRAIDVVKDLGKALIKLVAQKGFELLINAATGGIGGTIGGGLFGSIFGGLGFAHGGSFTVGGNAGIDNNMVALNLSRGEKVTVDPPDAETGGGSARVATVRLEGATPDYRRDIEKVIDAVNEAVGNGHKLRLVS